MVGDDRGALLHDVEALLSETEEGLRLGFLLFRADVVKRLVDIIRAQGAKIRTLEDDACIVSCDKCTRAIVGVDQGLAVCPWCELAVYRKREERLVSDDIANWAAHIRECDALRDRIAKLEKAARRVVAVDWQHGEGSVCPHLMCEKCCDGGNDCFAYDYDRDGKGCDDECELVAIRALRELLGKEMPKVSQ